MALSRFLAWRFATARNHPITRLASLLAVLSIGIGLAVMLLSVSVSQGFQQEVLRKLTGYVGGLSVTPYGAQALDSVRMPPRPQLQQRLLAALPSLQEANPYIQQAALIKSPTTLQGVVMKGMEPAAPISFFVEALAEGRLPQAPEATPSRQLGSSSQPESSSQPGRDTQDFAPYSREVLLSRTLANRLEVGVGDRLVLYFLESVERVRARPVSVSGLYHTGMTEFDERMVVCDLALLQRIRGWREGEIQGYELRLAPGAPPLETLRRRVDALLEHDLSVYTARDQYPDIFDWLQLQDQTVGFILLLMTLVALVNMSAVLLILITERTPSIGVLQALGASPGLLRGVFVWQAFGLIGLGLVLGNLLAFSLLGLQAGTGFIKLDESAYFMATAPVAWPWGGFLLVNLGTLAFCTLFMLLPAQVAARVRPRQALMLR